MAPVLTLYHPFTFVDPAGSSSPADWALDVLTVVWEWLLRVGRAVGQWLGHAAGIALGWLKGVAQATGVWMEEHWPLVTEALRQASKPVNDRPLPFVLVSAGIFLGPQILLVPLIALHLLFLFLLALIGFGTRGIVAGSPAAGYQSLYYGGNTPTGSLFSIFQSMGMKYNVVTLGNWVFAVIRLVAGIVFVYSLWTALVKMVRARSGSPSAPTIPVPIPAFRRPPALRPPAPMLVVPTGATLNSRPKKFSVNWNNTTRDRPIYAQLFIDGVECSAHFMLDRFGYPRDASCIGISYATTSEYTRRDFVFEKIVVTDDDAYLHTLASPPTFGTIRLELWEAEITSIRRAPHQHSYGGTSLEGQVIHETSKKAGAHHVRFDAEYVVPPPMVNIVSGAPKGEAPLARFTFNYRPAGMLRAGGIIPKPGTLPPPSSIAPSYSQFPLAVAGTSSGSSTKESTPIPQAQSRILTQASRLKAKPHDDGVLIKEEQRDAVIVDSELDGDDRGFVDSDAQIKAEEPEQQWIVDARTGRVLPIFDCTDL
uniref:DUF7918 domain-containing protein n=1 Tax=Mycena chlorophos TaxID=658473 RepID=A0ABQ0L6C0_MYCCL|nr:predicted protein [Mycena chlorophos]